MNRCVPLFVLFALFATAMGRPNKEQFEEYKQVCIVETGIDPDLVKGPPPKDGPVEENLKCFAACMMKQHGVLKEDGTPDIDLAISKIPDDVPDKDKIVSAINTCADRKGENMCDTAHQIMMCMHEQMPHPHGRHGPHGHHDE